MNQTEQTNHPFVEDSYYHPYTAKQQEEMNVLTHFPADYNQRFEESIKKYEHEIEDLKQRYNLSETPPEIHETFERLYSAQKIFFLDWAHAKTIAPPPSVVGCSGWKNPEKTFEKRHNAEEKAIERITHAEERFHKAIKRFIHEKKVDQEKCSKEKGFAEAIQYRKYDYAKKFGTRAYECNKIEGVPVTEYINCARAHHQKFIRWGLEHGFQVPTEVMQDYPKLCAELHITIDRIALIKSSTHPISPLSAGEKITKAQIEKYAVSISQNIHAITTELRNKQYRVSGDVYYTIISLNARFRQAIDQIKDAEEKTWERIYHLGDTILAEVTTLLETTEHTHQKEIHVSEEIFQSEFDIRHGHYEYTDHPIWEVRLKNRVDWGDFASMRKTLHENYKDAFWSKPKRCFCFVQATYPTQEEVVKIMKGIME